jgi:hypothetical protein
MVMQKKFGRLQLRGRVLEGKIPGREGRLEYLNPARFMHVTLIKD